MKTEHSPGELSCPACGRINLRGQQACGRCGCDLGMLWTIMDGAAWHLSQACEALRQRDFFRALENADRSWALFHTPSSAAAGAAAAVLTRQVEVMELWRNRCREGG